MFNMEFIFDINIWGFLAIIIIAWCVKEIIKNISFAISVTRSIKHLKDIPDDQRKIMMYALFNKQMKEMVKDESND